MVQIGRDATLGKEPFLSMNVLQSLVSVSRSHNALICISPATCIDTGAQPLFSDDGKLILAVNGEIYNHIKLRSLIYPGVKFKTHSDCEVILYLVCTSSKLLFQ